MPTLPENFMQIRSEVFAQSCKQTDRQTTITYILGGGNYSAKIPYARFCRLSILCTCSADCSSNLSPVYTIQPVVKPVSQPVERTACQTGCTTSLTTGCIV